MQLQWDTDDTTPPITGYTLEYKLQFEANWTADTISAITFRNVTDLYPSATYQVSVMVMS